MNRSELNKYCCSNYQPCCSVKKSKKLLKLFRGLHLKNFTSWIIFEILPDHNLGKTKVLEKALC